MKRAYYGGTVSNFLVQDDNYLLGELARNNQFTLEDLQRNTWLAEIRILKRELRYLRMATSYLNIQFPRIGNRIDNVFIYNGLVFLFEFKVGARNLPVLQRSSYGLCP